MKNIVFRILPKNRYILLAIVVVAIVLVIIGAHRSKIVESNNPSKEYRLVTVDRGHIAHSISTSGTLSAVVTVDVGSQVSGQISELHADFNSVVNKGQLIARIDPRSFESQVRQAEANLSTAKANVSMQIANNLRANAELDSAKATLENKRATEAEAHRELIRKKKLMERGVIAKRDLTLAESQAESAAAQVRAAKATQKASAANKKFTLAQIENAHAQVHQREAALEQAIINLQYTDIRAPVDGVVINRAVNLGQTVAASLNAPVLFTLAEDLRKMQVETNVDEADIGQVHVDQFVDFSVDAFPDKMFKGLVTQIRQAPQVVQNVVTYTVIVSANNEKRLLLPGMTASVNIIIKEQKNIIQIPNEALRYNPKEKKKTTKRKNVSQPNNIGFRSISSVRAGSNPGEFKRRLNQLASYLSLTENQLSQLQSFATTLGKSMAFTAQSDISEEEKILARKQAMKNFNKNMMKILSDAQRKKFGELRKVQGQGLSRKRGKVWILGEDGKPRLVQIVYGITDGSMTSLIDGNVKVGDQVIVGQIKEKSVRRRIPGLRF